MALTPMLALGVLFILWAGRSARAELVTSLAAQEAAVAAALCCNDRAPHTPTENGPPGDDPNEGTGGDHGPDEPADDNNDEGDGFGVDLRRELVARAVLDARPGLGYLCLGGPQPAAGADGFVTETEADLAAGTGEQGAVGRVLVVTAHVACETDGATAPVRGLFGTRTVHGHGAHIALFAHAGGPTDEPHEEPADDGTPAEENDGAPSGETPAGPNDLP